MLHDIVGASRSNMQISIQILEHYDVTNPVTLVSEASTSTFLYRSRAQYRTCSGRCPLIFDPVCLGHNCHINVPMKSIFLCSLGPPRLSCGE